MTTRRKALYTLLAFVIPAAVGLLAAGLVAVVFWAATELGRLVVTLGLVTPPEDVSVAAWQNAVGFAVLFFGGAGLIAAAITWDAVDA